MIQDHDLHTEDTQRSIEKDEGEEEEEAIRHMIQRKVRTNTQRGENLKDRMSLENENEMSPMMMNERNIREIPRDPLIGTRVINQGIVIHPETISRLNMLGLETVSHTRTCKSRLIMKIRIHPNATETILNPTTSQTQCLANRTIHDVVAGQQQ